MLSLGGEKKKEGRRFLVCLTPFRKGGKEKKKREPHRGSKRGERRKKKLTRGIFQDAISSTQERRRGKREEHGFEFKRERKKRGKKKVCSFLCPFAVCCYGKRKKREGKGGCRRMEQLKGRKRGKEEEGRRGGLPPTVVRCPAVAGGGKKKKEGGEVVEKRGGEEVRFAITDCGGRKEKKGRKATKTKEGKGRQNAVHDISSKGRGGRSEPCSLGRGRKRKKGGRLTASLYPRSISGEKKGKEADLQHQGGKKRGGNVFFSLGGKKRQRLT